MPPVAPQFNTATHHAAPFHQAVLRGDIAAVKKMLMQGMEVDTPDAHGDTAVFAAIRNRDFDMIRLLADAGTDKSFINKNQFSPAAFAFFHKYSATEIDTLRRMGFPLIGGNGRQPFHLAAVYGRADLFSYLLARGYSPMARDTNGNTPIHTALYMNKDDMVAPLMMLGVDATLANNAGDTPLHLALLNERTHVISVLLDNPRVREHLNTYRTADGDTYLMIAVQQALYSDTVRKLIRAGCTVNAVNNKGETALYHAAQYGDMEFVHLLVSAGADLTDPAPPAPPLLHAAMKVQKPATGLRLMRYLLDRGYPVDTVNDNGFTALHAACLDQPAIFITTLLRYGADPNFRFNDGQPRPFDIFLANAHDDDALSVALTHMLAAGADVSATSHHGRPPLFWTINKNLPDMTAQLLAAGASPHDTIDSTAAPGTAISLLGYAARHDKIEHLKMLIQYGADPYQLIADNDNLLHIAVFGRAKKTAQYLLDHYFQPHMPRTAADVTAENAHALHLSIMRECYDVLPGLIAAGCDPYAVITTPQPLRIKFRDSDKRKTRIDGLSLFHLAAHSANAAGITQLAEHIPDADWNITTSAGQETPLHIACRNPRVLTVSALLANGADPLAVDRWNKTPLHNALIRANYEVCDLLVRAIQDAGIDHNTLRGPFGWSPAHIAIAQTTNTSLMARMIFMETDINRRTDHGDTLLHFAVRYRNSKAFNLLFRDADTDGKKQPPPRVDVNAVNKNGDTALHIAVAQNDLTMASALVAKAGADRRVKNGNGQTALALARALRHNDMAVLLAAPVVPSAASPAAQQKPFIP